MTSTAGRRLKTAVKAALGLSGTRPVTILAGPARGVRMTLDLSGQTPMYLGIYEWELHSFLRATLPGARLVFDIGAHVGYGCLMFASRSGGRVVAYEPDPVNGTTLRVNIDCNPALRDRITVVPEAVAARSKAGTTTLDDATARFGPPDLVKLDVEGCEFDALCGAQNTLTEHRPHLIVETHSAELERDCGALLLECGYRPLIKHNRKVWREYRGGLPVNRWLLAKA
jgi:hypothetical protein